MRPQKQDRGTATVAFVLASYRHDEPAGMERATAALAAGLRTAGHDAYIITSLTPQAPNPDIEVLTSLPITLPCDDPALRAAITGNWNKIADEISGILAARHTDVVVYVDGLWGLGLLAGHVRHRARRVLAVHVVGHGEDLRPSLTAAEAVIAPSNAVLAEAAAAGYDSSSWKVIPNPLLIDPDHLVRPDVHARDWLRRSGPVRMVARLGSEKGIEHFLQAPNFSGRPVQLVLAEAGFESENGSQQQLSDRLAALAAGIGAQILPALPWAEVPAFLAGAAVTIVPSLRETFGNLAAESLSVGTPVVAYQTGNLPDLIGDGGICIDPGLGPAGLWRAVRDLTADPLTYDTACGAAYCRSRNYRPTTVADVCLKAVW